jgi:hypothetical protein
MIKIVRNNIEKIASEYFKRIQNIERRKMTSMHEVFIENLQEIVLCKSNNFKQIITKYRDSFSENKSEYSQFYKYMKNQYKSFFDKNGSWLAKQLKVDTCPYCNRQYTFTVDSNKKTKPQFDHFYPKSKYPYLALSFYNLIPCCPVCNHIKGEEEIDIHPYKDEFGEQSKFSFDVGEYILKGKIKIQFVDEKRKKIEKENYNKNITEFALAKLYSNHDDYVEEIVDKAYAYNNEYYSGLNEIFSGIGKSPSVINRLIFGNYLETAEHEKRPLSKLTKDILEQLGVK